MAATPIPATTSRPGLRKPLPVDTYTSAMASAAPASAPVHTGTVPGSSSATMAAPAPAPAPRPITSGLPSGLRVTDWNSAPESPKAAPVPMPTTRRGPRRRSSTKASLPRAPPVRASGRSARETPSRPRVSVAVAAARSRTTVTSATTTEIRRTGSATAPPRVRKPRGAALRVPPAPGRPLAPSVPAVGSVPSGRSASVPAGVRVVMRSPSSCVRRRAARVPR